MDCALMTTEIRLFRSFVSALTARIYFLVDMTPNMTAEVVVPVETGRA